MSPMPAPMPGNYRPAGAVLTLFLDVGFDDPGEVLQ